MTARTDLHRPSTIVPADYDFVSCDYYGPGLDAAMFMQDRMIFRAHMERTGGRFSGHEHGGTCHVCGAHAMYVAKYHHRPSNAYIVTGLDCAEKMDIANPIAFRSFKKRVAAGHKARRGIAKAEAFLAERDLTAAWAIYRAADRSAFRKQEEIVTDIVGKLVKYGSISDPQTGLVRKLMSDIAERPARDAVYAAKIAEQAATSRHVGTVGQRQTFDLTVARIFKGEGHFGPYCILNCTDQAGNVVVYKGGSDLGLKVGDRASVTATVKGHDAYKGIAQTTVSRPKVVGVTAFAKTPEEAPKASPAAPAKSLVELAQAFEQRDTDSYESEGHR